MRKTLFCYLQDLSVDIQHVDGDLDVPGHALATFLELAFLQRDVKVIPHLSCSGGGRKSIDYAYEPASLMATLQLEGSF